MFASLSLKSLNYLEMVEQLRFSIGAEGSHILTRCPQSRGHSVWSNDWPSLAGLAPDCCLGITLDVGSPTGLTWR